MVITGARACRRVLQPAVGADFEGWQGETEDTSHYASMVRMEFSLSASLNRDRSGRTGMIPEGR